LRYQTSTIQRWLKAIPPAWIATHAPLAVAAGWQTWFITGTDTEKTVASMQLAADAVTALPNESQFDELRMEAQTLQVLRCIIAGDAAAARSHAEAAERMPHAQDSLATAYLNMLQAAFIDADADIELRLQRLQHAGDVCRRIGFGHGVIEMTFAQLLMMWRQCMFERAQAVGVFLQATIAQAGWKYSSLISDIHYFRGEMYFLIDQIDSARQCLQLGLEHGRADGPTPSSITDLTRVMLEICEAIESPDDSAPHDMDADAHAWADILQHQSPLYQCMAAWPRLLRDLCAGRLESCRQTFETLRITPADLTSATADRIRLAVLAGAVFSGRNDDVIPEKLTEFRDFLRTTQFTLMRLQVEALQALDAQQRGDMPAALRILAELLPEIERTGAVRIVLNMPPLQRALSVCALPFAHQLLKRFPGAREVTHDFGLTPHEHHILADLASNLSPKDIATAHHLSVATVRVHTQRIYRKLHVHSREEAVAKARVLGMLE
jgi:LuxR family maltose regulon positive regulatory protein